MKKALLKDSVKEIKNTYKRFISILLMAFLGVGFFAGLRATSPDMLRTIDNYYKEQNVYDIQILSTLGLTSKDVEEISKIEESLKEAKPISEMLDEGLTLEEIAKIVTGDENIEILEQDLDVTYKCNCSKEKIENGIISLGKEEISKIIEEDGKLEAECHFCHKKYNFSLEELKEIERGAK